MALTKVGKEGVVGLDNSADATAITIDSAENVAIGVTSKNSSNNGSLTIGHTGMTKVSTSANGNADELVLIGADASANVGMSIISNNANYCNIFFGDEDSNAQGLIQYNHATDSLSLSSNGAAAMSISSIGAVTKPLQPAFHAQPASLQANIAVNTAVTVVYGTETYDVGSNFASNTFTAPITGKYLLCYSLYLQALDTAANYYEAYINSSNRDYYASTIDPDFGDADWNYFSLTGSSIVDMDANDTAKIILRQSTGTAQSDINTPSFFSGALIC